MSIFSHDAAGGAMPRRSFLTAGAIAGASALLVPERVLADPYQPWSANPGQRAPVRVRGVVQSGGRGIGRVPVTDGIRVVDTGPDGTFDFVSSSEREFVYITVPAGFQVPVTENATARFYAPLRADSRGEMSVTFDLQPLSTSDSQHTMLLLADIQTEDAEEMRLYFDQTLPDIEQTIRGLNGTHHFSIACGDIVFDALDLYPDYERATRRLGMPAFQVVGNHDLDKDGPTDDTSTRTFRSRYGPPYYSFNRGAVHYVVLDDVFWHGSGYFGYLDAAQLAWLEQDLQRIPAGSPLVIALHIPVEGTRNMREGAARPTLGGSVSNRDYLYRLVEPFRTHFLAGHTHDGEHVFRHGTHGHISGTVCGAWWSGPVCGDGTPNGYAVYEARGEEIRWRYKSTGHPADHQIRAYARGAVPEAPTEVVANIWNWDPEWKVTLWEGADRRGPMAPRVAVDPLARSLYTPDKLPEPKRWVGTFPTEHLFFAPVLPDATSLRIEAIDRFGNVYSAPVPVEVAR